MKNFKLGFIVEGDTDKVIIETLARRLLPSDTQFHTVRTGSKSELFHSAHITVFKFLDKAYNHVIALFDTDSTDQDSIGERVLNCEEQFRRYDLLKQVTVCPVIPEIEVWLLANYFEPFEIYRPKVMLAETIQEKQLDIEKLVQTADINLMKKRNASFASFVEMLQNLGIPSSH
ncbi:hypothetical protein QUF72_07855 [Desulfobacterales bacterium HSG2]|nr:hypothetical protein [Desulfobacterales bacterium HSG2]